MFLETAGQKTAFCGDFHKNMLSQKWALKFFRG